jgi:cytochrome P450
LHVFTRFVLEDLEFAGISLKKGQSVALMLGSANRDGRRYENPDRLDFTRGGAGHVGFGAGIHFCIGAPLARIEMAEAMDVLFKRLPGIRLAAPARYANRYHFHGLSALRVQW